MAGGDLGLHRVRAAAALAGLGQVGQAPADQQPVPAPAVLVLQQHRRAVGGVPGGEPGGLQLHQGHQAPGLGLLRLQRDHPPAQA